MAASDTRNTRFHRFSGCRRPRRLTQLYSTQRKTDAVGKSVSALTFARDGFDDGANLIVASVYATAPDVLSAAYISDNPLGGVGCFVFQLNVYGPDRFDVARICETKGTLNTTRVAVTSLTPVPLPAWGQLQFGAVGGIAAPQTISLKASPMYPEPRAVPGWSGLSP